MESQGGSKGKILIVEDEAGVAEFLQEFFHQHGYEAEIASDGLKAEECLEKERYQLILTDVIFFHSGGIDLINAIRKKDRTTPIVVMTGYGPEVADEAKKAGANEFLLKPFSILQMKRKMGRFLDFEEMEKRFGRVAVEKGFITPDELDWALKVQIQEDIETGEHRLIGRILLEKGLLTFPQIDEVIQSLEEGSNEV